jgi:hypothetical protein
MEDNVPEEVKVRRCSIIRKMLMMSKKEKLYNAVSSALKNIL